MNILAIGAHPDDIEYFCGGTLALYAKQGHNVFMAVATKGDIGAPSGTREEIAAIRKAEAQKSADEIGAKLIWMGFDDEFLFSDRESRMRFIDAIRESRADVMFVLSEDDYHPDHRTAGVIGRDARIPASVPLIASTFPAVQKPPTVFIMDTLNGRKFEPEGFVDISSVMDTKLAMLACHVSQATWKKALMKTDVTMRDDATVQSAMRGQQSGCQFAEAFRLLSDRMYTGGWELLPQNS